MCHADSTEQFSQNPSCSTFNPNSGNTGFSRWKEGWGTRLASTRSWSSFLWAQFDLCPKNHHLWSSSCSNLLILEDFLLWLLLISFFTFFSSFNLFFSLIFCSLLSYYYLIIILFFIAYCCHLIVSPHRRLRLVRTTGAKDGDGMTKINENYQCW